MAVFPLRKFCTEQLFEAHAIAQLCRHTTSETFQALKRQCDIIKFGMLQVRENEIPLHKWSGGIAQLRSYAP